MFGRVVRGRTLIRGSSERASSRPSIIEHHAASCVPSSWLEIRVEPFLEGPLLQFFVAGSRGSRPDSWNCASESLVQTLEHLGRRVGGVPANKVLDDLETRVPGAGLLCGLPPKPARAGPGSTRVWIIRASTALFPTPGGPCMNEEAAVGDRQGTRPTRASSCGAPHEISGQGLHLRSEGTEFDARSTSSTLPCGRRSSKRLECRPLVLGLCRGAVGS